MPKPNIVDLFKKSLANIENRKDEVKTPVEAGKSEGNTKKGRTREKVTKKSKNPIKREIKATSKDDKKKKGKPKPKETVPLDKKVTLKKFHGQVIVDIREYFMDKLTREMMPGKKGVSLTLDQVKELKSLYPKLDESLPTFSCIKNFSDPLA